MCRLLYVRVGGTSTHNCQLKIFYKSPKYQTDKNIGTLHGKLARNYILLSTDFNYTQHKLINLGLISREYFLIQLKQVKIGRR
jgi:hypothetical protein